MKTEPSTKNLPACASGNVGQWQILRIFGSASNDWFGYANREDFSAQDESSESINYKDCGESATILKPLNCNCLQKSL